METLKFFIDSGIVTAVISKTEFEEASLKLFKIKNSYINTRLYLRNKIERKDSAKTRPNQYFIMVKERLAVRLLKAEEKRLDHVIRDSHIALQNLPDGNVEIKRHNNSLQFYLREDPHEKHGVYMPVSKRETAQAIIQKNYLEKIVSAAEKQIRLIQKFIKTYDPECLERVFLSLGEERRKIVEPVELPDDLYVKNWLQTEYEHKGFINEIPEHYTMNNERVRSKSEVLIADTLFASGIPYRYECPLVLSGKIIHPDFTILRICDRKEIYWEHLGLMDDSDYRNHALKRIREYEANGIFPGDSLVITMETYKLPLSRNVINSMIRQFLISNSDTV